MSYIRPVLVQQFSNRPVGDSEDITTGRDNFLRSSLGASTKSLVRVYD